MFPWNWISFILENIILCFYYQTEASTLNSYGTASWFLVGTEFMKPLLYHYLREQVEFKSFTLAVVLIKLLPHLFIPSMNYPYFDLFA